MYLGLKFKDMLNFSPASWQRLQHLLGLRRDWNLQSERAPMLSSIMWKRILEGSIEYLGHVCNDKWRSLVVLVLMGSGPSPLGTEIVRTWAAARGMIAESQSIKPI